MVMSFLPSALHCLGGLVDGLFLDGAGLDGNVQTAQVVLIDVLGLLRPLHSPCLR